MEGNKIYEDSYKELVKIRKSLSTDTISINVSKLDETTKYDLITAIIKVVTDRQPKVFAVTSNPN